jgi:putative tryptophan/tyrosine transport system substrate-binding protein
MRRNIAIWLLTTIPMVTVGHADAQQPGKIYRIGYLDPSTAAGSMTLLEAFRQELRKLGWIDGRNISVEYRFSEQRPERLPDLAAELVRLNVDVIVSSSTPSALAAKSVTSTIPIIMANAGDPVSAGIVGSLARPGGNVTGLASLNSDLAGKRLEVFKEAVPRISRVGILWSGRITISQEQQLKEVRSAASLLKLEVEPIEIELSPSGVERAFQTATEKKVNAVMPTAARIITAERNTIVHFANKHRLPAIYFQKEFVDAGGLMSYGTDYVVLYRRAAYYVDKILKGAKPADLPVEQPMKFEFVINLKSAKQIGVTIPPNVLARADKVIT